MLCHVHVIIQSLVYMLTWETHLSHLVVPPCHGYMYVLVIYDSLVHAYSCIDHSSTTLVDLLWFLYVLFSLFLFLQIIFVYLARPTSNGDTLGVIGEDLNTTAPEIEEIEETRQQLAKWPPKESSKHLFRWVVERYITLPLTMAWTATLL